MKELNCSDVLLSPQNVQQTLEERQSEFDTAVEHYHEIASSRRFIRRESVKEKCIHLTEKWNLLSSSVPGRINSLHEEIQGWAGFYSSLDQFTAWLEEMEGFTRKENLQGETEAQEHLKELEVCFSHTHFLGCHGRQESWNFIFQNQGNVREFYTWSGKF